MLYDSRLNVPFKVVDKVKAPKKHPTRDLPEGTYWAPTRHGELVKTIRKVAKTNKLSIKAEHFQLADDDHTLYASWDFKKDVPGIKGLKMSLCYRGSNTGRFAHTFGTGGRVELCQNGIMASEFTLRRKHTTGVDLLDLVSEAFDTYLDQQKLIKTMVSKLRNLKISDERAMALMFQAGREGIIAWSRLRLLDKEWRTPTHVAFKPRNGWSLYNAFTQMAKITTPAQQIQIFREVPDLILPSRKAA